MARIAMTGTAGFIGATTARLLVREGHNIRGLARSGASGTGTSLIRGDVRDPAAIRMLVDGCDALVHLAPGFGHDSETVDTVEQGTETVLTVCRDSGIKRLVFVSCLGAEASAESPYYAAKWRAETAVRNSGLDWVILRPSLVLGRGDGVMKPLARVIQSLPVVPIAGDGRVRLQPIDIGDMAGCISVALHQQELSGQMISVGGPVYLTVRHLIDLLAGHLGVSRRKLLVPSRMVPTILPLLPEASRPLYQPARLAQFRHGVVTSPGIVNRMFGFEPRSVVSLLGTYAA